MTDSNGNYMTLSYYKDAANREMYLDQIDYTGNTNTGLTPTNQIKFIRDSGTRPDAATSYLTRFAVKTIYRLSSIEVQAKINGVYNPSRKYELSYSISPSTNRSMLSSVLLYGYDINGTASIMPATLFTYQQGLTGLNTDEYWLFHPGPYSENSGGFRLADVNGDGIADFVFEHHTEVVNPSDPRDVVVTNEIMVMLGTGTDFLPAEIWGQRLFSYQPGCKGFRLADMNGDGLVDYVYDHNGIRVLLNSGNGFLDDNDAAHWGTRTNSYSSGSGGFRLADINRDGMLDVIYENSRNIHVFTNTGSGLSADTIRGYRTQSMSDNSGGFQMVDMNGDGMADYVYDNSKNMRVMLSTGTGFPADVIWGVRTQNYDNNFPGFKLADLNGDGLPDLIYDSATGSAGIRALINTGINLLTDAKWGSRQNQYSLNSGGFQVVDMNNDGMADFLYDNDRNIRVLISTGASFGTDDSTALWGQRLESYRDRSPGLRIADVTGDGIPDVVYDSDSGGGNTHVLSGKGPYPDLISTVDNGIGGLFTVAYAPSSSPLQRIHETMPFVLQTVESITADDGLSEPTTTFYTYAGGFYDIRDREFRGFGYAQQINPDLSTYETWYHQRDTGPWYYLSGWVNWGSCFDSMADDDDFKGKPCHTELREPWPNETTPGTLLSETDMYWGSSVPQGTYPAFVRPTDKIVTAYVGGTAITNHETYLYNDTNGTLTNVTTSGPDAESITTENAYGSFGTYLLRTTRTTVTGNITGKIRETTYGYQTNTGNMLWKEFWLNGRTNPRISITYYTDGTLNTETDAKSNTTSYTYDDATKTFPKTVTNALGFIRSYTYNYLYGKVDCATDENLNKTCSAYDVFGRQTQAISYTGAGPSIAAKTKTEYHDFEYVNLGLPNYVKKRVLETITGTENYIDGYSFVDGFGRTIESITFGEAGKSIVAKTFYDNMGRAYHTEGPFFGSGAGYDQTTPADAPWSDTTYNYFGKPIEIQSPYAPGDPAIASIAYSGLSTTVTDPDGNSKTETKDYLGRVKQVVEYADAGTQTTNYVYNAAGDLLTVTDHNGNTTTMTYDTLGRKITMTDPDMGYWQYTYDANGNLLTQTDAKGQIITFAYDTGNRVLSKTYSPVSADNPPVTYTYDNLSISNGKGRPYSVSNTKATTTYNGYDAMGRATSSTKTIQGDATQYTTATVYDYSGKPTTMTYPDGYQVTNTYHPGSGLLYAVTGSDSKAYAVNTLYEPTGKIGQINHANNTATRYTYDPKSTRMISIIATSPASNGQPRNDLINRGYTYTAAGNIGFITDYKKGNELNLPGDIFNYEYQYDKLHRFTNETTTNNVYNPVAYTYNAIGNILSKAVGSTSFAYTYDPVKKHAVNSIRINGSTYNFGYDLNGNMTSGYDLTDLANISARTIGYNADNMPVQVTHARYGTTNISYDGTSNRVKKISPSGAITYYVGEHFEVKNNEPIKYIFAGNLRVAKVAPTGTYFFHKDHLGSSAAMTTDTGAVVETSNYMPFGEMREHSGIEVTNYKFTDQEFDPETGLYYYGARYYDPTIGRFISPDSVVQDPYDPQTLNRYTYCRNNPIIYTDPSGHFFLIDDIIVAAVTYIAANAAVIAEGAAIGAAIGGISAAVTGGNILQGMLTGAISGAIFAGIGSIPGMGSGEGAFESITQAAIHAGGGAASGGINSAITGGNIGVGMVTGGISAGIAKYAGSFLPNNFASQLAGRAVIGGITAEIYGGDFGQGFMQGAKTAAIAYFANDFLHDAYGRLVYHRHNDNEPSWGREGEKGVVTREIPPDGSSQAFFDAMATVGKVYLRTLQVSALFVRTWGVLAYETTGVVLDFVTGSKGDIPLPGYLSIPDGINPDEAW